MVYFFILHITIFAAAMTHELKPTFEVAPSAAAAPATSAGALVEKMVEIKNLGPAFQMLQQTDGVQDALQASSGLAGGAATPAVPGL